VGAINEETTPTELTTWHTSPALWEKLKPLVQQMRHDSTPAEKHLWQFLRKRQRASIKFRRQHSFERFIVDFYCSEVRLVVEVDGEIHQYSQQEDRLRQEFLESLGLRVIRFTNAEVLNETEGVLKRIEEAARFTPPLAPPRTQGGESQGAIGRSAEDDLIDIE